jgi:hypothetical protein
MYKRILDEFRISDPLWPNARSVASTTLVLILASTTVFAADGFVATLAQPLAVKKEIIIENNLFRCEGSTCLLVSQSAAADTVAICRALQHKVGHLTGYVAGGKTFDADRLAKCNAP